MLGATTFQITLLSGQNWQNNLQLYVLGGVFLVASAVWYTLFRLRPSVYVLSFPWIFYALAFFLIGLPTLSDALHPGRTIITNFATWSYAVASAAAFLYFGLNFGEEAVSTDHHHFILFCISSDLAFTGCGNGGLDFESMYCSGISTDLGHRLVVLGSSA